MTSSPFRSRSPLILLLTASMLALPAGCSPGTNTASLDRVQRLYDDHLDGAASAAAALAVKHNGPDADRAAWIGGLAEFRRGQDRQAAIFFERASQSRDATIAGGAQAMLGQIATRREDLAAALAHYDRAWYRLEGSDRRQAALRALAAARIAGNASAVGTWQERLDGAQGGESSSEHPFVLQAGAYRSQDGAEQRRETLARWVRADAIEPIVVRQRSDAQGTWWLVHCGAYSSRAQAASARRRVSGEEFIVVRVAH